MRLFQGHSFLRFSLFGNQPVFKKYRKIKFAPGLKKMHPILRKSQIVSFCKCQKRGNVNSENTPLQKFQNGVDICYLDMVK